MERVDAYASERHYWEHLRPIWLELDESERGTLYLTDMVMARGDDHRTGYPMYGENPLLVASFKDHQTARQLKRQTIYLEHGAGQRYQEMHASYAGSPEHEGTVLFLCPREEVCEWWRAVYPDVPAVAVGNPKLDAWHGVSRLKIEDTEMPPTAAISFHSDVALCYETRSAFSEYELYLERTIRQLKQMGFDVLGHAHPRLWPAVQHRWEAMGAEPVREFGEVLDRADVFAADNSSALPEAASIGIPLVWINASFYRRDVEHGGRFWRWPRGQVVCDSPGELTDAIELAWEDHPSVEAAREEMVAQVYEATDGKAARRVADAIRSLL